MRLRLGYVACLVGGLVVIMAEVAWGTVVAGPLTYNDHEYYLVDQGDSGSWTNLEAEAVTLGGHLVTINDAAENEWVRSTFPAFGPHNMWIGLNDIAKEGLFEWVSGEPVTYTNWGPGEPGAPDGISDFVGMTFSDGLWGDRGWGSVRGVVEVVPEPSTAVLVGAASIVALRRRRT
ncbi:MAG: PEP-CTERM sorting domain-containing protein [Phycisphaerae bacterium]|nr:PEP-CTERM sorting domain-containing protein [Phycisphaerae bacterium]